MPLFSSLRGLSENNDPTAEGRKDIINLTSGESGSVVMSGTRTIGGAGTSWTVDRAVKQGYERVPPLYSAIEVIAEAAAARSWGRRKRKSADSNPFITAPVVTDFALAELLNGANANPNESGYILRKRLSQQIQLSPRGAFAQLGLSRAGEPYRIDLLPPGRTRPVPYPVGHPHAGDLSHFEVASLDITQPPTKLDPSVVRWWRNPHPTDPWRSMTPLEAMGLTVEIDYFSRVMVRNFLANDGRPGMVLGVDGDLEETEMDRIERRFGGGPQDAGRTVVIAGKLTPVDMSANPREAGYHETRNDAKTEALSTLGIGESLLGNAAGRTFDNADAEEYGFWTRTMASHFRLLDSPLHSDAGDGFEMAHDTSDVEVLRRWIEKRETELLEQVNLGLISFDEYRIAVGRDPINVAGTRVLWIVGGKVPVGDDSDVTEAQKLGSIGPLPPAAPPPDPNMQLDENGNPVPVDDGSGAPPVDDGTDQYAHPDGLPPELAGVKALPLASDSPIGQQLSADLAGLTGRWAEVVASRLASAKGRRNTVFWDPPGTDLPSTEWIVQPARWIAEAESLARRRLPAAATAGATAADALAPQSKADPAPVAGQDVNADTTVPSDSDVAVESGVTIVTAAATAWAATFVGVVTAGFASRSTVIAEAAAAGAAAAGSPAGSRAHIAAAALATTAGLSTALVPAGIAAGGVGHAARVAALTLAVEGTALASLAEAVRVAASKIAASTPEVGRHAAQATQEHGLDLRLAVLRHTVGLFVQQTWNDSHDEKVRPTHRVADGQTIPVGALFNVGADQLRFPGDPLGSPAEVFNCFPDDTLVQARGVAGAYRRLYTGRMVSLHLEGADDLTATPNHPVLTARGWLPIDQLVPGDYLVGASFRQDVGIAHPDKDRRPALIQQVVRATVQLGVVHRVPGTGVQFHGDGGDGYVDVVRADRELLLGAEPTFDEPGRNQVLAGGDSSATSQGLAVQLGGRGLASTPRDVGRNGVGAMLLDRPAFGQKPVRLDLASRLDAISAKAAVDGFACAAKLASELRHAGAHEVALHKVLGVDVATQWHGYVANLETADGLYIANGIVSHNCRCRRTFSRRKV